MVKKLIITAMLSMALTSVMAAFISDIAGATDIVYGDTSNKIRRITIGDTPTAGNIILPSGINASQPAVSPDGNWLVYKNLSSAGRLYVRQLNDTGTGTQITSFPADQPTWSPDSQTVAYTLASGDLYSQNNHGSGPQVLRSNNPEAEWPIYSPDGAYIYYTNNTYGGIYRVTIGDPNSWTQWGVDDTSWPAFSPGGIFATMRWDYDLPGGVRWATVVAPSSATIYVSGTSATMPNYSPDGTMLAFVSSGQIKVRQATLLPLAPETTVTTIAPANGRPYFAPTASTGSSTSSGIALVDNIVGKGINGAGSLLDGNAGTIIAGLMALALLALLIYSIWRVIYKSDNRGRE